MGVTSPLAPRTPDSCRLALPREARSIATIQRRSWEQLYAPPIARHLLAGTQLGDMTDAWEAAIRRPPLAQFRVLVAVSSDRPVGFAAIGPSDDPDADPGADGLVAEFVVDPPAQRRGHGSRLVNAVADTLRADGFARASWWVRASDDPLRAFLASAGWGPDGAHRTVATDETGVPVKVLRYRTILADPDDGRPEEGGL